jgi:CHAT domain-containing protein
MSTIKEVGDHLEIWLADKVPPELLLTPLPDEIAGEVIERLKQEADRHWYIDPRCSLELADRIVSIGQRRNDNRQIALGFMARGDALRFLGRMQEAWQTLTQAGDIFQTAGDQVGWARTRISHLYLAVKLNYVAEALADANHAQAIFNHCNEQELQVRLHMALATVYTNLGEEQRALELFRSTITIAEKLGKTGEQYLGNLYMNTGVVYEVLGEFSDALTWYQRALTICLARNETRTIALLELNIAYIAQAQGHYRQSLDLLHGILDRKIEHLPIEYLAVKREMTECYLQLNRYSEARHLAREVVTGYREYSAVYETGRSLLHLATAEAESGNYPAAQTALEEAQHIFASLGATSWSAITRLKRGRIALKQGDANAAFREAVDSAASFNSDRQQVSYATATLMKGQALFMLQHFSAAVEAGKTALHIAQRYKVPSLRYTAHLLLGQIAEAQQATTHAIRRYQAAAMTIERVQSSLTITLRPGFLEDKGEASRALIAIYFRSGQAENAFEALERAKSQILLGYLANRESLRWTTNGARSQILIQELTRLRAEHQWFYQLAQTPPRSSTRPNAVSPEQALAEVAVRERRMRTITEQLYIHSNNNQRANRVPVTSLSDIQHTLNEDILLIEFYSDGTHLWAFVLNQQIIELHCLPITIDALNPLLAQLQSNVAAALKVESQTTATRNLTQLAQRILRRLYGFLLEPLMLHQYSRRRLMIVPYGILHYLPFHLLYDGSTYLIEKYEIVILPAAGLATQRAPRQMPGALVLANSFEGRLPHTLAEAQMVQQLFGGTLCLEEKADRLALQTQPVQILHIAAHGEHRLDQPDLSYLQLADGQLYADDMLQQDLRYELVTLSACETGRANVAASDELIGLGRGFLYAGAGALLVSLWRVADTSTLHLMERIYKALFAGASKAAALREAQRSLLAENREVHPAFWGAFQLIGDASSLSKPEGETILKGEENETPRLR